MNNCGRRDGSCPPASHPRDHGTNASDSTTISSGRKLVWEGYETPHGQSEEVGIQITKLPKL
jgi:hypothetical protein